MSRMTVLHEQINSERNKDSNHNKDDIFNAVKIAATKFISM
jgi:hypothetical protein